MKFLIYMGNKSDELGYKNLMNLLNSIVEDHEDISMCLEKIYDTPI